MISEKNNCITLFQISQWFQPLFNDRFHVTIKNIDLDFRTHTLSDASSSDHVLACLGGSFRPAWRRKGRLEVG